MAKLMWICGILLIAAGIALGAVLFVATGLPGVLTIDTAAILLVGGVLALGLGGVIDAVRQQRVEVAAAIPVQAAPAAAEAPAAAAIPEFGPRGAKAAAAAAAAAVAVEAAAPEEAPAEEVSRPTRETIQALENARQRIEQAFDARKASAAAKAETAQAAPAEEEVEVAQELVAEEEVVEADVVEADVVEEAVDDGQLYVVEERVIRRHPARILSDGTVEAETSEGWMRFENLEHLDEYLDAMEPARG